MTLVFFKENDRSSKGVGFKVTQNKYFNVPRSKRSFSKDMSELKSELENSKNDNKEKDDKLMEVMKEIDMLKQALSALKTQRIEVPGLSMLEDFPLSQVSELSF